MAQFFDNQYFNTKRYKIGTSLDINTDLVVHSKELSKLFKTMLHRMRNIAKTNSRIIEVKENRKPRIAYCGYSVTANDGTPVNVCSNSNGGIFFNGLATCGSYWRCPVCAVKISEAKKELIADIITTHQESNQRVGFVTLTIRHTKTDTLKKSVEKLTDNYRRFQQTRFYRKFKTNIYGQIKTLEITFNEENGWHSHLHILYFYNNDLKNTQKKLELFQKQIISRWAKFRNNYGSVFAQNQQILTSDISDYIAKYDIAMEMTKGQIKGSKGLTPFTALAKLALNNYENYEEKRKLYGIYSIYVEYTHGKHFVNISNSLLKLYPQFKTEALKSDEQLSQETEIDKILFKISVDIWKLIAKNDLQPLILNKYHENGLDSVFNLLSYFKDFKDLQIEIDNTEIPILI